MDTSPSKVSSKSPKQIQNPVTEVMVVKKQPATFK